MTNSDKITNAAITLELFDGYTVEMCRLTLKQMADLDAYTLLLTALMSMRKITKVEPHFTKACNEEIGI